VWVFVEAGLQAGLADLKVGLYTNTSELRCKSEISLSLAAPFPPSSYLDQLK
jgi:hypothetical protein